MPNRKIYLRSYENGSPLAKVIKRERSSWNLPEVDGFGYRLVGVPNTAFVLDGSETAYVIHVNAGGELFQSLVELKLKETPQGVPATFDRKWMTAGATATLKVAVAKGKVVPGSYKLTVEGKPYGRGYFELKGK